MKPRVWMFPVAALLVVGVVVAPARASADEARDHQWYLASLRVGEAQAISQGEGVVVAVIDTGVDAQHPDLVGNVLPGKNMTGVDDQGWVDPSGHGTSMAAVIAGHGHGADGSAGILGIAPKAKILPVTVPEGSGVPGATVMSDGIRWAVAHGANVINISMSSGYDGRTSGAVTDAVAAGVMIVASAGNRTVSVDDVISSPADDPRVVAVSATDQNGVYSPVSVHGYNMAAAAPGVGVPATVGRDGYAYDREGTSPSAAIVSGVFALAKAKFPGDSRAEWHQRVLANTIDKGDPGPDDYYGFGLIDPVGALTGGLKPLPAENRANTGASTTPSTAPTGSADAHPGALNSSGGNTTAVIVGIAVGGAVLAILVVVGITAARRRRNPQSA